MSSASNSLSQQQHHRNTLTEKGDLAVLKDLVRKSPEILKKEDECGASPLHHAAAGGYETLINFINTIIDSQELNSCDKQGNVPLHWAVEKNKLESCRALLDLGADPNILNMAVLFSLHLAISLGHNSLVELLLSYSATNCNLEGDLENSPVILACSINNCEAVKMLIKHGAKLCQQNKLGHFAIHAAAFVHRKPWKSSWRPELGHSADCHINYLYKSSSSPLHLAFRGGNIDVIRLCITNGAKIDQQQNDKCTPLHLACTQGATEVVKLMLSSVDCITDIFNLTDGVCQTPLHRAAIFDHVELADYLISLGAELNNIDCKGHSPLLVAISCGAWKTMALLLSKGAKVNVKDTCGRNLLHLAILQPKGLKNFPEEVMQNTSIKVLLNYEDNEGCTPLHYACRLGIHDSVKNMLGLVGQDGLVCKSKDKKSVLHFAAQYGRINTCHRLLESITDSRLLNEGDERGLMPLHLASRGGHTKVAQLLLRKGALFHSDYRGLTCLHHAAAEGFTQTIEILLSANPKLMANTDEDGNTALHLAARAGHVGAVRLMLNRGAELVLNKNDTSFLHEALQNGQKDVVKAIIDSERCTEALMLFSHTSSQRSPILDMIEFQPETYKHLLDCCVKESDDDHNSPDYHIEYDFKWLQVPLKVSRSIGKIQRCQPLAALNLMVKYNRIELLNHPVCKKYLQMKWIEYGSRAHLLNMFIYLLGLLSLTYLIIGLRPTMIENCHHNISMRVTAVIELSEDLSFCMIMVLFINICHLLKAGVQIYQQLYTLFCTLHPWCKTEYYTEMPTGPIAVLYSWIGLLLYLQRFEIIGIYVVMFRQILKTLLRIAMLFVILMLGFALTFHSLMLYQIQFKSVPLSVVQTFVMMVGELNYQSIFFQMYQGSQLPFPIMTYCIFVIFVLIMPILLVNLMTGLAVGDIAEVQRNAALKRIAMQIDLHTALEEKLSYWFKKRVDKPSITIYPNRRRTEHYLKKLIIGEEEKSEVWSHLHAKSQSCSVIENELRKQKSRIKDMSSMLVKQHGLLKLIVQKMEISPDADECDGPVNVKDSMLPGLSQVKARGHTVSRWVPLMKAIESKRK